MQSPCENAADSTTDSAIDQPVGEFDWGPHGRARRRALPYVLILLGISFIIAGLAIG